MGLCSYEFRKYDPIVARWLQPDPLIKFHESPYSWVSNNPVRFFDLLGLDTVNVQNLDMDNLNPEQDVVMLPELAVSSTENDQHAGFYVGLGMMATNAAVGAVSTYTVYAGKYHKWNEVWHQYKTAPLAWRWEKRWNTNLAKLNRVKQIESVAKARNLNSKLTKIGAVLIVSDIALSGEIKPSHVINGGMLAASTTGVGSIFAGIWFVADFGTMGVNYVFWGEAKGIGDMIDESLGTVEMYEGVY